MVKFDSGTRHSYSPESATKLRECLELTRPGELSQLQAPQCLPTNIKPSCQRDVVFAVIGVIRGSVHKFTKVACTSLQKVACTSLQKLHVQVYTVTCTSLQVTMTNHCCGQSLQQLDRRIATTSVTSLRSDSG